MKLSPGNLRSGEQAEAWARAQVILGEWRTVVSDMVTLDGGALDHNPQNGTVVLSKADVAAQVGRQPTAYLVPPGNTPGPGCLSADPVHLLESELTGEVVVGSGNMSARSENFQLRSETNHGFLGLGGERTVVTRVELLPQQAQRVETVTLLPDGSLDYNVSQGPR